MKCMLMFWGRRGGGEQYSLKLAEELTRDENIDLHLSVSRQTDLFDNFEKLGLSGFHVNTYSTTAQFISRTILVLPVLMSRLESYIRKHKIEVVLIGMIHLWSPFILSVIKKAGAKSVVVVHEREPHVGEKFFNRKIMKWSFNKSIERATSLIALTDAVREQIIIHDSRDQSEVFVVPHGCFSFYKARIPRVLKDEVRLLFFGRIAHYKGLDILLEAVEIVHEKHPRLLLEIWGDGDVSEYRKMLNVVSNVNLENRWVDDIEISDIFRLADICVLPYREASQSGIVGIALEAGMPIVACPQTGLIEQTKNGGAVIAENSSPQAFARAICLLLEERGLYETLSKDAIEVAKDYSWFHISSMISAVMGEVRMGGEK